MQEAFGSKINDLRLELLVSGLGGGLGVGTGSGLLGVGFGGILPLLIWG